MCPLCTRHVEILGRNLLIDNNYIFMTLQICINSNSSKIDSPFVVLLLSLHPQNVHYIQHLHYQFSNVLFPIHTTKRFFHLHYFSSKYLNVPLIYPKKVCLCLRMVQTISCCRGTSIHIVKDIYFKLQIEDFPRKCLKYHKNLILICETLGASMFVKIG